MAKRSMEEQINDAANRVRARELAKINKKRDQLRAELAVLDGKAEAIEAAMAGGAA